MLNVLYIYSNLSMQGKFKMEYRLLTIVRYNYRDYCERYELKIDYVVMDQVCTWSHYQVDILLYD